MMSKDAPPEVLRLLTISQVARRYGVAPPTIWRWEAAGRMPKAIRVTRGTVRWREDEIEQHLESGVQK